MSPPGYLQYKAWRCLRNPGRFNCLWNSQLCDRFQAYEIFRLIGYGAWRNLFISYISNPDVLINGWPDLFIYDDNRFCFVEIKVRDNIKDNQIQTLRILNTIFPRRVYVAKAYFSNKSSYNKLAEPQKDWSKHLNTVMDKKRMTKPKKRRING